MLVNRHIAAGIGRTGVGVVTCLITVRAWQDGVLSRGDDKTTRLAEHPIHFYALLAVLLAGALAIFVGAFLDFRHAWASRAGSDAATVNRGQDSLS
jgi:hypothetical protein